MKTESNNSCRKLERDFISAKRSNEAGTPRMEKPANVALISVSKEKRRKYLKRAEIKTHFELCNF